MSAVEYYLKKFRRHSETRTSLMATTGASALAVTACGSGSGGLDTQVKGFPDTYTAPKSIYIAPTELDPNFETLKPVYSDPYWVASLEMDQWDAHIIPILQSFERSIHYTFPEAAPAAFPRSCGCHRKWYATAADRMKAGDDFRRKPRSFPQDSPAFR